MENPAEITCLKIKETQTDDKHLKITFNEIGSEWNYKPAR